MPPRDPPAIAAAVERLLDPDLRQRLGHNATVRSLGLGVEAAVEHQQRLYERLARRRRMAS